jgi:NCS2 family nucleobase:cation symporter-2
VTLTTDRIDTAGKAPSSNNAPAIIFGVDDRPPPFQWLAFSFQHLMVAFAAMIGVPLAFSWIVKLGFDEQTALISGVLVAGGVVTMIQSLGVGPIGARLPLVNDATFKFLGPLTLAYKFGGFGAIYGAAIVSGLVIAALGLVVAQIQRYFNTFIVGTFLIITGVSLMPIALNNLLAIGKPYEATTAALVTAAAPLAMMIYFSLTRHPYLQKLRALSVLLGFIVGYALAAGFGLINWAPVIEAPWFGLAMPYAQGIPTWPGIALLVTFTGVFMACLIETAGDATAVSAILGRRISAQQIRAAVFADGLSGPISSIFGGFPMTTYGQNVGLVRLSGVGSRFVVAGTGAMLIIVGAIPKVTALIASMPSTVLGAGLVMTFGMIAAEGVRRAGPYMLSARNAAVLTLGLVPAVSLRTLPQSFLARIPQELAPLLTDALVTGLLIALVAHLLLPGGADEPVMATEQRPGSPEAARPAVPTPTF